MTVRWTTPADLRVRVRRRWEDGSFLRAYAAGEVFATLDLPLRGPRPGEIGAHLEAVQTWAADLDAGRHGDRHYALRYTTVGGRSIGRNDLPARAVITTYDQVWSLLGVTAEVERFASILRLVDGEPDVRGWVLSRPLRALELRPHWPALLSAYRWLRDHRHSGRYLREISAPGVDTKFAERHRSVLAGLLHVSTTTTGFLTDLGLAIRPEMLRLRADPALGAFSGLRDLSAPVVELRDLTLSPRVAVIVENEITFLSVPVPEGGLLLWGEGFDVHRAGSLPWLSSCPVHYWGDLDTHGFAILDQLRAWLPQTRSFLMDRPTLLAHQDRWGREDRPTSARLSRLDADETALYSDLVSDRLGEQLRLEQERIDWSWARSRFDWLEP